MKNRVLFLLIFGFAAFSGHPQSLSLFSDVRVLPNGSEIFQSGRSDTSQLLTWLHITNVSSVSRDVLMKKEELSLLPGASASICWAGYCYDSMVTVSVFPLALNAGDTSEGCFGHYAPRGGKGESAVRWTFYVSGNPDDSVSVTAHYGTYPSAAAEIQAENIGILSAGRLPASSQADFSIWLPAGMAGHIELHDLRGNRRASAPVTLTCERVSIPVGGLPPGLYTAVLIAGGRVLATVKVPVMHP